jgi:hypothetical protein
VPTLLRGHDSASRGRPDRHLSIVPAASSDAGYVQRQADRTEDAKRRRQPEQLTWASVRPPQVPVQGAVGKRPAEPCRGRIRSTTVRPGS